MAALNILARTIAFVILLVPGGLVSAAAQEMFPNQDFLIFAFVLYLGELFVVTVFHELGHALAAWLCGWPVEMIAIVPIAYRTKTKRFEFWTRLSADLAGMVVFRAARNVTPFKLAFLSLAGPLASFVFAALMLALSAFAPWRLGRDLFGSTGAMSVFFGIGNLIPFYTSKGMRSDGLGIIHALFAQVANKRLT